MTTHNEWLFPRGALARDGWESVVDASLPGWRHTGLRVADLGPGDELALPTAGVERFVVPLSGSFTVRHEAGGPAETTVLAGRASVFDGPSDVLYLSTLSSATVSGEGRVAIAEAPAATAHPSRYVPRVEVPVELRDAGRSSRQVHNFGTPSALEADRFIVCEVITPAENWSSYPAHKHDEDVPGHESRLEEIYYFETAVSRGVEAPAGAEPFGMFSTSTSPAGEIAIDATVRTGDIALVPFGYHGPAVAAPGYDLYYLNVMAGPGEERAWLISDHPAHGWIRSTWDDQAIDPRLPYTPDAPDTKPSTSTTGGQH
ncbi:5-deoxyglucuronate isomerase [Rathayibacter sp. PhB127]|uniref:5-deoxy-glucuronate isomerase n=1 Tax=Rathayibacter sp. PhB127 TaxID=2485176 RepID=UPI000F4B27E5|nr:5-deoxy-glucuronate isomerase [Rathayibacter sp. PhB127]ROS23481.1 5-deoxyglucuronate isomerase [Rathayibacter sp. PhB127]